MPSRRREPAVDSLFLFTARPFDADTGLQNNLNRWYDPVVGGWLSEDPVESDLNIYRYVYNDPLIYSDPTGFQALPIAIPVAGGAAAADGPLPFGDICTLGILGIAAIIDLFRPHGWFPCDHPVGTTAYRGPDYHAHYPFPAGVAHYHLYVMHQSPYPMCGSFWHDLDQAVPSPPPGSVVLRPAGGGGAY